VIKHGQDYRVRRQEIIDTARRLFFQKGYETTTVQDIIDALDIAKGTFYHYFSSKMQLLDSLVEEMVAEMSRQLQPIADSKKNAIEKINEIFRAGTGYKVKNIDLFLIFLKTLYQEENYLLRARMFERSIEKNSGIIEKIVKQGIKEGVFNTSYPEYMGEIIINLGRHINEVVCKSLLSGASDINKICVQTSTKIKMYQDLIERILGAARGSIKIYVPGEFEEIMQFFFEKLQPRTESDDKQIKRRYRLW